jgi:hypothetical protein
VRTRCPARPAVVWDIPGPRSVRAGEATPSWDRAGTPRRFADAVARVSATSVAGVRDRDPDERTPRWPQEPEKAREQDGEPEPDQLLREWER